jgi:hypothetical protein
MKIYLASLYLPILLKYHERFPDRKLNVLRSFGQLDNQDYGFIKEHRQKLGGLILDSGTWTLNNAKQPSLRINFPNYKRHLAIFKDYYDHYFNFDADFNDDAFESNLGYQLDMEREGLNPIPVIHDIFGREIDYYIKRGYQRVALGSKQIRTLEQLEYAMNKFKGTGIKVHLFGKSGFDFLCEFPIDSTDTADWVHEGKYGDILYWNPEKRILNKGDRIYMEEYIQHIEKKKVTFSSYKYREELEKYLQDTLGITYEDILGPGGAHVKMLINVHYYAQLEDTINRIHREKGFI